MGFVCFKDCPDPEHDFHRVHDGVRVRTPYIVALNYTNAATFYACVKRCVDVAVCRAFAYSAGQFHCELYVVDDSFAQFATTWLYAASG